MLIAKLDERDDTRTFTKFLDLPAELRNCIYEFYMVDFPSTLRLPTTPPLARTNRKIREDVLPLFYSSHEFEIHFLTKPIYGENSRGCAKPMDIDYFIEMSPPDLANIRRLKIIVKIDLHDGTRGFDDYMVGFIDLHNDGPGFGIDVETHLSWSPPKPTNFGRTLYRITEGLEIVEERRKLHYEDMEKFPSAISAAILHDCEEYPLLG